MENNALKLILGLKLESSYSVTAQKSGHLLPSFSQSKVRLSICLEGNVNLSFSRDKIEF